jgi:hypothetical protein
MQKFAVTSFGNYSCVTCTGSRRLLHRFSENILRLHYKQQWINVVFSEDETIKYSPRAKCRVFYDKADGIYRV